MTFQFTNHIQNIATESGATDESIKNEMKKLSVVQLPEIYIELMKHSDGAEGNIGKNEYLALMPIEELHTAKTDLAFDENIPYLIPFGSDGGGMLYAFDTRTEPWRVIAMDFLIIKELEFLHAWDSFEDFINTIHEGYEIKIGSVKPVS